MDLAGFVGIVGWQICVHLWLRELSRRIKALEAKAEGRDA